MPPFFAALSRPEAALPSAASLTEVASSASLIFFDSLSLAAFQLSPSQLARRCRFAADESAAALSRLI